MENKTHTVSALLLNTQRALLGEIESSFRAITVEWQDHMIIVYFYIDGVISEELRDKCTSIATEIVAAYIDVGITEKIIRLDYPQEIPIHPHWAYRREEPFH